MEFFCQIVDGKEQRTKAIDEMFKGLNGRFKYVVEPANKRSNNQNRYLWGVVYTEALKGFRDLGYDEIKTTEEVHEIFKYKFLRKYFVSKEGEGVEYVGSTAKLTTIEMLEYIEAIAKFAAENLHVVILPPNTQSSFMYAS